MSIDLYIFTYILLRAVLPVRTGLCRKVLLAAGAALMVFFSRLMHIGAEGGMVSSVYPRPLLIVASWSFAVSFFFLILLVGADALRFAAWLARTVARRMRGKSFRTPKWAVDLLLLTAASLLASCGMVKGIDRPEVFESEISSPKLPEELDGLRIVLVSDLHVDDRRAPDYLVKIVEQMDRLDPDLVAIAGDFADGSTAKLAPWLEALRAISSRYGVFGVPGNHEYYSGYRDYMGYLPKLGVVMLENSHRMIHPKFAVAGITDPAAEKYALPGPDLDAALAGIPEGAFVLLLAHRPVYVAEAEKRKVDLQLSGHLHGGLVWGLGWMIARMNGGYLSGLYRVGDTYLYVSRGTSTWGLVRLGFQVRLGVPAEITVLTLRRAK